MSHQRDTPFTGTSPAQISLIGTLSVSLMTIGAPFTVAWAKRFSPRLICLSGTVVFSAALILASFSNKLWQFELTQGFLLGIGTCLAYMVTVSVAPTWFGARRGLALGIITSGTGIGGLIWAPALKACIERFGFRQALRMAGGIAFVLNAAAATAMAWEPQTRISIQMENSMRSSRASGIIHVPLVDWRVAKSRRFIAHAVGAILQSAAYYLPLFFFATYARSLGYSNTAGANFIAISNACNAIGKVVIGYAADRMGRLNALVFTTAMSAIATAALWIPSTYHDNNNSAAKHLFISFTVMYGIFASAYVALFPTSLVELFGAQNFASVNGVLYMVRGLATLVGTPVGGAMIRGTVSGPEPSNYSAMSILTSALLFAASLAVIWVRIEASADSQGHIAWKWKL